MKVKLPVLMRAGPRGRPVIELFAFLDEDFFLRGPVSRRLAVLDFDDATGQLLPGPEFVKATGARKWGYYEVAGKRTDRRIRDASVYRSRDFNAVSAFATALRAIYMFEEADTLGRRVRWAFNSPQLLLVPRAGDWGNAFYERDSHSLQFFSLPIDDDDGGAFHTSLSHDIVTHETTHAVLDGIAPDLYDSIHPQSLAIHEAIADLASAFASFQSKPLQQAVLPTTQGSIQQSSAFSSVAAEFGGALGRAGALRQLLNDMSMPTAGHPLHSDPHTLSQVLSGAVFAVTTRLHNQLQQRIMEQDKAKPVGAAKRALQLAASRMKRIAFRALDYLPPGEVSFVDYGRALFAADAAYHPTDGQEREWLVEEFVRRNMIQDSSALEEDHPETILTDVDLEALVSSDFVAYEFAKQYRTLLGIPEAMPFSVYPRVSVAKRFYLTKKPTTIRECLFKVAWTREEENRVGPLNNRQITVGTTLAIDWQTKRVTARLTSDVRNPSHPETAVGQSMNRDAMLLKLIDEDLLRFDRHSLGADGKPLKNCIAAESTGGTMRLRGTGRMLHVLHE